MDNIEEAYWTGPFDILIPIAIQSVPARFGYNLLYSDDKEAARWGNSIISLTEDEYKTEYATFNQVDGRWYYTGGITREDN